MWLWQWHCHWDSCHWEYPQQFATIFGAQRLVLRNFYVFIIIQMESTHIEQMHIHMPHVYRVFVQRSFLDTNESELFNAGPESKHFYLWCCCLWNVFHGMAWPGPKLKLKLFFFFLIFIVVFLWFNICTCCCHTDTRTQNMLIY